MISGEHYEETLKKYLTDDEWMTYINYQNGFVKGCYEDALECLVEARMEIEGLKRELDLWKDRDTELDYMTVYLAGFEDGKDAKKNEI